MVSVGIESKTVACVLPLCMEEAICVPHFKQFECVWASPCKWYFLKRLLDKDSLLTPWVFSQCHANVLWILHISKLYSFMVFLQKNPLPSHYTEEALQILCLKLEPPHPPAQRLGSSRAGWALRGWLVAPSQAHLATSSVGQPLPRNFASRWRGDLVVLLHTGARECFSWRSALLSFTGHGIREALKDMAWSLCCFGAMETDTHLPNILWKCLNTSNTLNHVCALLISELPILAVYFLALGRLWVWCPSFQIHVWSMLSAQLASSSVIFFFPLTSALELYSSDS